MALSEESTNTPPKVAFYNNPFVRGLLYQLIVGASVVLFGLWLIFNTIANLQAQNKTMGFDFLGKTSGFSISFSVLEFDRTSFYWEAFLVGLTNTLMVAVIGIVLATIVGFAVGIARLSSNWIIAKIATVFIEVIRNIPLLLQLFFWYFAVLKAMPAVRESFALPLNIFINQRGVFVPKPITDDAFGWVIMMVPVALIVAYLLANWAKRRLETTGARFPVFWTSILIAILLFVGAFFLSGATLSFEAPELQRFNFRGGLELPPEFVALVFGLTIYTAAFIAETVRGGILAVNSGQTEAAQALGLQDGDRLRLVVVPQAMRVIIPPLTSQYLNLTKNSSLGAAIGFPELVNVWTGTSLNQTGRAIEIIAITMLVYLTLSLTTSVLMNWYNSRIALVER